MQFLRSHWRTILALIAVAIVSGTVWYSSYLANKIEADERQRVEQWVLAVSDLLNAQTNNTALAFAITQSNRDIPIIEADERGGVIAHYNLDSAAVAQDSGYLQKRLKAMQKAGPPIVFQDPLDSTRRSFYYYGKSRLQQEVRYYPLVQLVIVALFIVITFTALRSSYRNSQNQVWAGMAKETAHQLGTPVSSLEGWMEILSEVPGNGAYVKELRRDVHRLRLVSDRFGKIGSSPQFEKRDVVENVHEVVDYLRQRAPGRVKFSVESSAPSIVIPLSATLFDWVIENLLKNALDAMDGSGKIRVRIAETPTLVNIEVEDSGKGISSAHLRKIFKPGFTTKKRGWGLGLSLSRRIVEDYHGGKISARSEPGKGTTFSIVLKKG